MDIDEIRRNNLWLIEREMGNPTSVAEKVGMTPTQYINLRDGAKDSKTGKPRGMRKETAWKFEDAFSKQRGWLDQDHSSTNDLPPEDRQFIDALQTGVAERQIPDHIRQTILTLISSSPEKK